MPDLILLHAPSVYDFRQKTILYGPVSDLIPPSPAFEMYPIGFASMSEYLGRAGYKVRIVNLAVRMLRDRRFNAERMIRRLNAPVFGIDLHWMVHSHGAIEVARLVKKYHPHSKVVFGGFSSSYFYRELLQHPEIDYVLRGDSTEEPLRQLMDCIIKGGDLGAVPNLAWRNSRGQVQENVFSNVPANLDNLMVDAYGGVIRSVIKHRDLISTIPFKDWLRYPILAVFLSRGCNQNCVVCGGSAAASRSFYHREKMAFWSPESVARNVRQIERFSRGPIFVLGDLCQADNNYAHEVLRLLEEKPVKNQFIMEVFEPVSTDILQQMSHSCPNFCLEISPESHDPEVRRAEGRNYSNEALERMIGDALGLGCGRVDVFFMMGLPKQTPQSALDSVDYCDYLLNKFKGDKRLCLFTAPLSPFLDPGSLGFEHPERYGYHVLFRSLEEHRQALLSPSWKYSLNYETDWMTRHQIADTGYEAILRLNRVKAKHGVISPKMAELGEQRIKLASEMMHRIDGIMAGGNLEFELPRLKAEVDRINNFPISEKTQLELPLGLIKLKLWQPLLSWLTG